VPFLGSETVSIKIFSWFYFTSKYRVTGAVLSVKTGINVNKTKKLLPTNFLFFA